MPLQYGSALLHRAEGAWRVSLRDGCASAQGLRAKGWWRKNLFFLISGIDISLIAGMMKLLFYNIAHGEIQGFFKKSALRITLHAPDQLFRKAGGGQWMALPIREF
jgi:hypothetical protein